MEGLELMTAGEDKLALFTNLFLGERSVTVKYMGEKCFFKKKM